MFLCDSESFKRFHKRLQIFWKTKTFFKKPENYFLAETAKIEST